MDQQYGLGLGLAEKRLATLGAGPGERQWRILLDRPSARCFQTEPTPSSRDGYLTCPPLKAERRLQVHWTRQGVLYQHQGDLLGWRQHVWSPCDAVAVALDCRFMASRSTNPA